MRSTLLEHLLGLAVIILILPLCLLLFVLHLPYLWARSRPQRHRQCQVMVLPDVSPLHHGSHLIH